MSQLHRAVAAPLFQVILKSGSTWTGTEAQLRRDHPDWVKYATPVHVPDEDEGVSDDKWPPRVPNSVVRYGTSTFQANPRYQLHPDQVIPLRTHRAQPQPTSTQKRQCGNKNKANPPDVIYAQPAYKYTDDVTGTPKRRRRVHWLVPIGLGMLVMLLLWQGGQTLSAWWQVHQDDVTYGRPRTYQVDAVVGHNDSKQHPSHFIAVNLHSRVYIIEFPGGDATHARVYIGPQVFGNGSDLAPVTLTFSDPDHPGKPNMIIHVQGSSIVYLNNQIKGEWQFVPQQSQ